MNPKHTKFIARVLAGIIMVALVTGASFAAYAAPGDLTRVSVDSSGGQANGGSNWGRLSADGRFVAFGSGATNLVPDDTNNAVDVFVHDRQTGATTRVSVRSNGSQANGSSVSPAISGDGRFVAFYSEASNLVGRDTNGCADIFVHDRQTGETTRVSVDSRGVEENAPPSDAYAVVSISNDGRFVAFYSDATNLISGDTNNSQDIFVHDRQTGRTTRVSVASDGAEANGGSNHPNLSGDGRYVTFASGATNLVVGDTNGKRDVFVRDLQTGSTTLVSVNTSGAQADGGGFSPDISGDGRYVVFLADSGNLDPRADENRGKDLVYVHDRQIGQTTLASVSSEGRILTVGLFDQPTISRDGRYVAFSFYDKGDNNGIMNIWVRDLQTGESMMAAGSRDASSFGSSLSADGKLVAFNSGASDLVSGDTNRESDIFVKEVSYGPERDPTVASVTPDCGFSTPLCSYPTASSVAFIVIFSEQVTGVTVDDFSLTMLDGVSGASITGVSGYGTQYFVTVDSGIGEGKLRLDVLDNDSIKDSALNPPGGAGGGNGDYIRGHSYWIDKTIPIVTSITRADPNPTTADTVGFTVNFSEAVGGVDPSDFSLMTTGNISGALVANVSGSGNMYTATVNTGTGDGSLRLDLIDNDTIGDWDSPPLLGGTGIGNGNFTTGETYTINKSTPNVPIVTSSLRTDSNPTNAASVNFAVTFSEAVSGVDPSDFSLTTTGSISGVLVTNVSGSGNTYTVTAGTGSGDGDLRLDVVDDDSILNATSFKLGGSGAGNGNFTSGETYTINKTVPIVTGSLRTDPNPTTADSVHFIVTFSEAVSGVDASDFRLTTTDTLSHTFITDLSGSANTYTLTVTTGSGNGTLRLDLVDDDSIMDASGIPLGGAGAGNGNFTTGAVYTINKYVLNIMSETFRSNGRNDGWILESNEDSNIGGSKNFSAAVFKLGDDAQDRQFRSILHFPTYYLPDDAVVTQVILMIKKQDVVGIDPFTTHQNISVDIRNGLFGNFNFLNFGFLQLIDFEAPADLYSAGTIQNNPVGNWYWASFDSRAFPYINLVGVTQFRLGFQLDDNDDLGDDYVNFYSGDYQDLKDRPHLLIEYYRRK